MMSKFTENISLIAEEPVITIISLTGDDLVLLEINIR